MNPLRIALAWTALAACLLAPRSTFAQHALTYAISIPTLCVEPLNEDWSEMHPMLENWPGYRATQTDFFVRVGRVDPGTSTLAQHVLPDSETLYTLGYGNSCLSSITLDEHTIADGESVEYRIEIAERDTSLQLLTTPGFGPPPAGTHTSDVPGAVESVGTTILYVTYEGGQLSLSWQPHDPQGALSFSLDGRAHRFFGGYNIASTEPDPSPNQP